MSKDFFDYITLRSGKDADVLFRLTLSLSLTVLFASLSFTLFVVKFYTDVLIKNNGSAEVGGIREASGSENQERDNGKF